MILFSLIGFYYVSFNKLNPNSNEINNFKSFLLSNNLTFVKEDSNNYYYYLEFIDSNKNIYTFKLYSWTQYNIKNIFGLAFYENGDYLTDLYEEYNFYIFKNSYYNFLEINLIKDNELNNKINLYIHKNFNLDESFKSFLLNDYIDNDILNNKFYKNIENFNLYKYAKLDDDLNVIYNYEYYNKDNFFILYVTDLNEINYDVDLYDLKYLGKFNNFNYNLLFLKNISKINENMIINKLNNLYYFEK